MHKKIIKNILISFSIFTLSFSVVGCSFQNNFDSQIWLITDGGTINDESFNQFAYSGTDEYVKDINKNSKKIHASYFEPLGQDYHDLDDGYKIAKISGAKVAVLTGFQHEPYLKASSSLLPKVIILDSYNSKIGAKLGKKISKGVYEGSYSNVLGILFASEISAFEASLSSFFWLNSSLNSYQKTTYNIATFGGQDSPMSVNNYLWGFISAALVYRAYRSSEKLSNQNLLSPSLITQLDKIKNDFSIKKSPSKLSSLHIINGLDPSSYKVKDWFSNSFAPGKAIVLSDNLINNQKADLILPAAGPETIDVLNEARHFKNQSHVKIIGIDSPQASILNSKYLDLNQPIITSAEKLMNLSSYYGLKDVNTSNSKYIGKTIISPLAPTTSKWIGIEKTDNINANVIGDIYKMMNDDNQKLIRSLYEWYNKYHGNSFKELLINNHNPSTAFITHFWNK